MHIRIHKSKCSFLRRFGPSSPLIVDVAYLLTAYVRPSIPTRCTSLCFWSSWVLCAHCLLFHLSDHFSSQVKGICLLIFLLSLFSFSPFRTQLFVISATSFFDEPLTSTENVIFEMDRVYIYSHKLWHTSCSDYGSSSQQILNVFFSPQAQNFSRLRCSTSLFFCFFFDVA